MDNERTAVITIGDEEYTLLTEVFQTAVATGDLSGCLGGQEQGVLLIADEDGCGSFVIHHKLPPLSGFLG